MAKKAAPKKTIKAPAKKPANKPAKKQVKASAKRVVTAAAKGKLRIGTPAAKATTSRGRAAKTIFNFNTEAWISAAEFGDARSMQTEQTGVVVFIGKNAPAQDLNKIGKSYLKPTQLETWTRSTADSAMYSRLNGPIWFYKTPALEARIEHYGLIEKSAVARAREAGGSIVKELGAQNLERVAIEFHGTSLEEEKALLVGLEMGSYFYSENCGNPRKPRRKLPQISIRQDRTQLTETDIAQSADVAIATNIARHLVNTPADRLNPQTYAAEVTNLFSSFNDVAVDVWEGDRLDQERMGLLQAVGRGAELGPRLVHIRYRPSHGQSARPVAFVGKGITFDTGGLDMKPSSAMRWMKKDMGGSAAVVGLAYWAAVSKSPQPCDFYLAIADNAVSDRSFRPGDIVTARNGLTIEIHNTDAEGRLVLADALDVAITQDEKPSVVINVATLTGAIKVALGAEIAGLFCNSDELSDRLMDCSQEQGDLAWRMPLFTPYKTMMRSNFADMLNATDGFAGAITAALFLQQFVGQTPWAHFDIYAWRDSAGGACSEAGGNGQGVQPLIEFLRRMQA